MFISDKHMVGYRRSHRSHFAGDCGMVGKARDQQVLGAQLSGTHRVGCLASKQIRIVRHKDDVGQHELQIAVRASGNRLSSTMGLASNVSTAAVMRRSDCNLRRSRVAGFPRRTEMGTRCIDLDEVKWGDTIAPSRHTQPAILCNSDQAFLSRRKAIVIPKSDSLEKGAGISYPTKPHPHTAEATQLYLLSNASYLG